MSIFAVQSDFPARFRIQRKICMKKSIPGHDFIETLCERKELIMRKTISMLLLSALLLPCLTGCTASADQRNGEAEGYGGKLKVTVSMNGDDITDVKVVEHSETQGVGTRAIDALPKAIEEADSVDVDSVSGATITSEAIKQAVSQALGNAGMIQQVIPMDGTNATEAASARGLKGVGMASTGRVGPGKDSEGGQVYSFNVVFASGEFEEDGTIRAIKVDQLEVVTPNLGGGSVFSGFPQNVEGEEAFLKEVSAWETKGAMGDSYMLESGSWRDQMDAYEQAMVGKTVDEVKTWYESRGSSTANRSETEATDASDAGAAQPVNDMADVDMSGSQTDAASSATMSLQGEYGDILLAIERAWEDARKDKPGNEGTMVDTNTLTNVTDGEANVG